MNLNGVDHMEWLAFARDCWEKQGTSGEDKFTGLHNSLTPAIFRSLVAAADEWREECSEAKFCFWIDGIKQDSFDHLLPRADDMDFACYDERVRSQLQQREYTLLLAEPHTFNAEVWAHCKQITNHFLPHTGLPNGWLDTAIFLGSYRTTPFGVHQGPMSVLTIPLVGRKSFRLWSPEYVGANPSIINAMVYEEHIASSYQLSAGPGGFIYWPSREWHVAESENGGFTAALSIGIWCNQADHHPLWTVVKLLEKLLARAPLANMEACDKPFIVGGIIAPELPPSIEYYIDRLEAYVRSGELRSEALGLLVQQYSTQGFKLPPKHMNEARLQADEKLLRDGRFAIVAAPTRSGTLAVAANGHTISITDVPGVRRLLAALDRVTGTFTAASLFEEDANIGPGNLDIQDVLLILGHFLVAGCIARVT